jgi:hypothetical protein
MKKIELFELLITGILVVRKITGIEFTRALH